MGSSQQQLIFKLRHQFGKISFQSNKRDFQYVYSRNYQNNFIKINITPIIVDFFTYCYNLPQRMLSTQTKKQYPLYLSFPPDKATIHPFRRFFAILFMMLFYQGTFWVVFFTTLYAIFTLNFKIILILATISITQSFVPKSELFVRFANKIVRPILYYKSFNKIYEEPLDQSGRCVFGFHPHSVFCFGILANTNLIGDPTLMPQMIGLCSRLALLVPISGMIVRLWGFEGVHPQNVQYLMHKVKKPIGLVPGGFQQATLTTPNQMRIFVKKRYGFIKYALNHNYTIYPVLILGQHKAFWTFDYFLKFRLFLNKIKFPGVFFCSRFGGLVPPSIESTTIVGRGIHYKHRTFDKLGQEKLHNATNEEVEEVHQQYIQEIKRIFQKYKHLDGNLSLKIY